MTRDVNLEKGVRDVRWKGFDWEKSGDSDSRGESQRFGVSDYSWQEGHEEGDPHEVLLSVKSIGGRDSDM